MGDWVQVYRAGDVIPKVADVDLKKRPKEAIPYAFPSVCPECQSDAIREEGDAVRRCTGGLICPAQAVEKMKHFVSRAAFDIEGLGAKQVEQFFADGWIKEPADIFSLRDPLWQRNAAAEEPRRMGDKSAENLFDAIDERRTIDFHRLLFGLGIRPLGEAAAKDLARHFLDWPTLASAADRASDEPASQAATREALAESPAWGEFLSIDGVGQALTQSLVTTLAQDHERASIDRLVEHLTILPPDQQASGQSRRGQDRRVHRVIGKNDTGRSQGPGRSAWGKGVWVGLGKNGSCCRRAGGGIQSKEGCRSWN